MAFSSSCSYPSECVMMGWKRLFNDFMNAEHIEEFCCYCSTRGRSLPWHFTAWLSLSAWYCRKIICVHAHYLGRRCGVFSLSGADCDSWRQRCTGVAAWCIWNQHSCDLPAISLWILPRLGLMNISWSRGNSWCTYPTAIMAHTSPPPPTHYTVLQSINTHTHSSSACHWCRPLTYRHQVFLIMSNSF